MRHAAVALLCLSIVLAVGCQRKPVVAVHPGAISNLDSYAYDILLVEQDAINSARQSFVDGKLPASAKSSVKAAIDQYNVTQAAWKAYHLGHSPANESVLQDALNALVAAVGQLQQVLNKPTPTPASPISSLRTCWSGDQGPDFYQVSCGGII